MRLPIVLGLASTALCAVTVTLMVIAERGSDARVKLQRRLIIKPIASLAFVAIPIVTGALGHGAEAAAWCITIGLALGMVGDLALMFENDGGFMVGLVAFLLGHLAYVVGLTRVVGPSRWFDGVQIALTLAPPIAAVFILRWLWSRLGSLRYPVIAYVTVITTMAISGLAVRDVFLTGGAIGFFLSDNFVARERFVTRDQWNRTIGLPLYYGAQCLFAWGVSPHL